MVLTPVDVVMESWSAAVESAHQRGSDTADLVGWRVEHCSEHKLESATMPRHHAMTFTCTQTVTTSEFANCDKVRVCVSSSMHDYMHTNCDKVRVCVSSSVHDHTSSSASVWSPFESWVERASALALAA